MLSITNFSAKVSTFFFRSSIIGRNLAGCVFAGMFVMVGCSASNPTKEDLVGAADLPAQTEDVTLANIPADEVQTRDVINRNKKSVERTGEIYLMRGLANVFSRGIDDMARALRQKGYDASNFSYAQWPDIAVDIVRRANAKKISHPVVIIGHSLGGNESSKFANFLAQNGVPVKMVVAFDPVETGYVGAKIESVVNYYLPKAEDNRILPKEGFTGTIKNIDVTVDPEITHTNVEKNPIFQSETYAAIANMTEKIRKRPDFTVDR